MGRGNETGQGTSTNSDKMFCGGSHTASDSWKKGRVGSLRSKAHLINGYADGGEGSDQEDEISLENNLFGVKAVEELYEVMRLFSH